MNFFLNIFKIYIDGLFEDFEIFNLDAKLESIAEVLLEAGHSRAGLVQARMSFTRRPVAPLSRF